MNFERLDPKKHNRKLFDCGVAELNIYLKQFANQDQKCGLTRVYVLAKNKQILGYHSICAHSVPTDKLPYNTRLGNYEEAPFLLLGRLAVHQHFQGQGYGDALIYHAFRITAEAADKIGMLGIIVNAKDEKSASFYERFGFMPLSTNKYRLVLPFSAMKKLF